MGKGTDKLYITHSEWSSEDAFSASVGAGARVASGSKSAGNAAFKRLPFNFCAVSLQPFTHPVCTAAGTIFDLRHILPWLSKHGTNPVDGQPLKSSDLIKLNFAKNDAGEYVDPVTYKPFTDNTHLVALRPTGNVFAYDTVERLNIKAKQWRDLVSDEEFKRADIITLQDPQNLAARDLSSFKYIQDGTSTLTAEEEQERSANVNSAALGNAARILQAKEAVAASREKRQAAAIAASRAAASPAANGKRSAASAPAPKMPYNAAQHTTGRAAASLTSTGLTPHTGNERAVLSREEFLLKPKRVKQKGYARISTTLGDIRVELLPEWAPKAVWNFLTLARRGYYNGVLFHRNIRNFMIQGGDPTGTGRGGASCWGAPFADELEGPSTHDARGVLSMANKGKNSNGSQFFITYRPAKHLDRKHTIFGRVVEGMDVLGRLEAVPVNDSDKRPATDVAMRSITILIDPFEEWEAAHAQQEAAEQAAEQLRQSGGTEADRVTWTGRRVVGEGSVAGKDTGSAGIGKYLKRTVDAAPEEASEAAEMEEVYEPPKKKNRGGGFGSFDNW